MKRGLRRVIFLDVDGVLNGNTGPSLNPVLMTRVGNLVREMHAEVVISSSWRTMFSLDRMRRQLEPYIDPDSIIDMTGRGRTRGREIETWLLRHGKDVDRIAILDDNDTTGPLAFGGQFDMTPVRKWLIQTDWATGITPQDVQRARKLLSRKGRPWDRRRKPAPFTEPPRRRWTGARWWEGEPEGEWLPLSALVGDDNA